MYETSDIRKGLKVKMDGHPWVVVDFQFVKPGKGNAFTRTKLKNLITGQVVEKTFKTGEKLDEVNFEEKNAQYLYDDGEMLHFMDVKSYEQFSMTHEQFGEQARFLVENMEVTVLFYEGRAISAELPTFVELEVTYTEKGLKGDTATGASKQATLSTGAVISVPLFINVGDVLKIDTRTGEYVERVKVGRG